MVLYGNYHICIFMNSNENLINEGKTITACWCMVCECNIPAHIPIYVLDGCREYKKHRVGLLTVFLAVV